MICRSLEKIFDFENLKDEIFSIINTVGFVDNQIILQSLSENEEWHQGVGVIEELIEKNEENYSIINSTIRNTEIAKIIERYQGFRTRIMMMDPRKCYSVHKDPTPRIHIPVITNSHSWMIWPHNNYCANMPVGNIYYADTTREHTFLNGGLDSRIHVVIGVAKFPKLRVDNFS